MNTTVFWRVVWKEYRQQRALWLAIAAAGIMMQVAVLVFYLLNSVENLPDTLFTLALSVPVLYSLGCGASLFAGEHDAQTFSFQQALPVTAGRVCLGKLFFGGASALALLPLLWLIAWGMASWRLPDAGWHFQLWVGGLIATIEVLIWAALGSLVLRHVLPAVVASGAVAAMLGYGSLVLWVLFGDLFHMPDNEYFGTLPVRSGLALAALGVVVWLGRHWFDERSTSWFGTAVRRERRRTATTGAIAPTAVRMLSRLIWQQWRQSRMTMFWMIAGYLCLAVWFCFGTHWRPQTEAFVVLLPGLGTVFGASVFWADQQGGQYRFFSEHGVRARLVWLSRQLVWGGVLGLVVAVAWAILLLDWPEEPNLPEFALGMALLTFTAGQVCSIFIRSGIVAIFVAVFCNLVLLVWVMCLDRLGVSPVVSTVPLPFIFLWATWLYAPLWIQDRTSWRVRAGAAASLVVPLVCVVAATAIYRVYEIPAITLPVESTRAHTPAADEARETARMYIAAEELLRKRVEAEGVQGKVTQRDAEWSRGIELFLAASERETCRFKGWRDGQVGEPFDSRRLARVILADAAQLAEEDDLDTADDLYVALLRLSSHYYRQESQFHLFAAVELEEEVFGALAEWAAHPQQSSKRILAMRDRVRDHCRRNQPQWEQCILENRELAQSFIALDEDVLTNLYDMDKPQRTALKLIGWLLAWERARMSRLLDVYTESELQGLRWHMNLPPTSAGAPGPSEPWVVRLEDRDGRQHVMSSDEIAAWLETTPLLHMTVGVAADWHRRSHDHLLLRRRAVQLQLELMAWRLEHGELPQLLQQLPGNDLEQMPLDPFTGQPFVYIRNGAEQTIWGEMGGMAMDFAAEEGEGEGGLGTAPRIERSAPFLWSPGSELYYEPSRGPAHLPAAKDFKKSDGTSLESEEELLSQGMRFTLPKPE